MNKKLFCVAAFLVLDLLMVGYSGITPSTSTDINGKGLRSPADF
jgi:hypothetical protein